MLAAPLHEFGLPKGWVAEPKWDGFRAFLACPADGHVRLLSRHGTELADRFPEIVAATAALPAGVLLDGELVVWDGGRLAFEQLTGRLTLPAAAVPRAAAEKPAHFVAFDLLHSGSHDYASRPYTERRDALERLFAERALQAPWTLCPMTALVDVAREWLTWTSVGMEGIVVKNPTQRYLPGTRAWRKYRVRNSAEAVIGAVTGTLADPGGVLVGRFDAAGRLRYSGRSTPLGRDRRDELAETLSPGGAGHPWAGHTFTSGWGSREPLATTLVAPRLVAEIETDVARDAAGRWRHPVRLLRLRTDLAPEDVPLFGGDT